MTIKLLAPLSSALLLLSAHTAQANATAHLAFPDTDLTSWQEKSFVGNTAYELVQENGIRVLKAQTAGKASVLYKEQTISLEQTPWIDWYWKIAGTYDNIDEMSRDGDDFPARLYVVAKTGFLPWETLAINYVWSSQTPLGTSWPNPHNENAHMISVQSGSQLQGQWIQQRRNMVEDFKNAFGINVDQIDGFAVMVDGDNSGQSGTAFFGNILFKAN